jgi:hypothetical protein
MTVDGLSKAHEVSLTFGFDGLDPSAQVELVDPVMGWRRPISAGSPVSVVAGPARDLHIEVRSAGAAITAPSPSSWTTSIRGSFPNPTRSSSQILLTLAQESSVAVEIADASGRAVFKLEPRTLPAGEHLLSWDGRSGDGRPAPPGIYFANVRAGLERRSLRIVRLSADD